MSRPWRGAEARARHCSGGRRPTIVIGVAAVVVNGLACQRRAIEARKRASSGAAVEKRERMLEEVKDAASVEATEAQAKISPSPSPSQPATAACGPALLLGLLLLGLLLVLLAAARCAWLGVQARWSLCWGRGRGVVAGAR